jgi:hypothetical protein
MSAPKTGTPGRSPPASKPDNPDRGGSFPQSQTGYQAGGIPIAACAKYPVTINR